MTAVIDWSHLNSYLGDTAWKFVKITPEEKGVTL
jgi:hypothetical protein